jgi:hypothetical protein
MKWTARGLDHETSWPSIPAASSTAARACCHSPEQDNASSTAFTTAEYTRCGCLSSFWIPPLPLDP